MLKKRLSEERKLTTIIQHNGRFVLLCADTCYAKKSWEQMILPGMTVNSEKARKSLAWVKAMSERSDCLEVLANHDPNVKPHVIELWRVADGLSVSVLLCHWMLYAMVFWQEAFHRSPPFDLIRISKKLTSTTVITYQEPLACHRFQCLNLIYGEANHEHVHIQLCQIPSTVSDGQLQYSCLSSCMDNTLMCTGLPHDVVVHSVLGVS